VKFDYTIREGIPEDEILSFVKEYKPSIIIMGTRGKSKKSEDLIGSVTAEIIESARNLPILAIPENFLFSKLREVKNIGFATSFKQQDLVLFSRFVNLIEGFKPTIHLFNISTSKNEWNEIRLTGTREYLRKQYPELDIQSTVLDDGNLLDSIDKFVKKSNIGIMTLCTNKRSLITRIFNPSIARKMVFHASTGLLVIPREYN
jgi:K+-sensing histidine kinase KdpD